MYNSYFSICIYVTTNYLFCNCANLKYVNPFFVLYLYSVNRVFFAFFVFNTRKYLFLLIKNTYFILYVLKVSH